MTSDLLPRNPNANRVDLAIAAWLDQAGGRSGSTETRRQYAATLAAFRTQLQDAGLDLTSDPAAVALVLQAFAGTRRPGHRHTTTPAGVSPARYNKVLAIMSSFYQFARRRQLLDQPNPADLVERRPVEAYASSRAPDLAHVQRAIAAIEDNPAGRRDRALLRIAIITGRRLAELAGLRWRDVQIAGDQITLIWRRTKGGKTTADTLAPSTGRALLAWLHQHYGADLGTLAPDAPVWVNLTHNRPGPLTVDGIRWVLKQRIGITRVHSLRHLAAQLLDQAGASPREIQARLGHRSVATTERYLAALKRAENPYAAAIDALFD